MHLQLWSTTSHQNTNYGHSRSRTIDKWYLRFVCPHPVALDTPFLLYTLIFLLDLWWKWPFGSHKCLIFLSKIDMRYLCVSVASRRLTEHVKTSWLLACKCEMTCQSSLCLYAHIYSVWLIYLHFFVSICLSLKVGTCNMELHPTLLIQLNIWKFPFACFHVITL